MRSCLENGALTWRFRSSGSRGSGRAIDISSGEYAGAKRGAGDRSRRAADRTVRDTASARRGRAVSRRRRGTDGPRIAEPATRRHGRRGSTATREATDARALSEVEAELHDEFAAESRPATYRHVTIVNASDKKQLELRIEVPVEDMARLSRSGDARSSDGGQGASRLSVWSSIHPRLLDLIRTHRSTLLFVNSRRLAERLAGALNELAGEPLVRSHHGSLAREARSEVEDLSKAGQIKALVATSSLELGIDMGAIDLVIQIEAPPSVASGLQRIGRAGHQAGATSSGIIFPEVPRRPRGVRGRFPRDARRPGRIHSLSAQPARRARSADRRHGGRGHLVRRRSLCDRQARGAVRRLEPPDVRGRARHAVGTIPLGRVRGAAAAGDVGSGARHT